MLPTQNRLKSDKEFALLAKSRKSAFTKAIGVKVRENQLPHSRFGVVVGLKVSKRAVKRNIIKRRLREIIRKHLPELKPGYDAMVLSLPPSLNLDYAELEAQTLSALKRVGLLIQEKKP